MGMPFRDQSDIGSIIHGWKDNTLVEDLMNKVEKLIEEVPFGVVKQGRRSLEIVDFTVSLERGCYVLIKKCGH